MPIGRHLLVWVEKMTLCFKGLTLLLMVLLSILGALLGGFTAQLLPIVVIFSRHWLMFGIIVDFKNGRVLVERNKAAICQVTFIVLLLPNPYHKFKYPPENSDFIMVIRDLFKEFRLPLTTKWVKGHQDVDLPYV